MVTLPRCRSHWTFGKHMKPQPVVDEDWMPIVWGLMDLNMYYSSVDGVQTLKFDRPDKSSVVLSPAIAAVLFTFLGGQAAIEASWESKDHVAALFALRQLALEGVRSCRRDGDVPRFKSTLSELEIVKTVYGSRSRAARTAQCGSTAMFIRMPALLLHVFSILVNQPRWTQMIYTSWMNS
jgi:hypothetical protein